LTEQVDLSSAADMCIGGKRLKASSERKMFRRVFHLYGNGNASAIRWKTAKAEELFALMIHYQGRVKAKDNLIETLWPEFEPEKSANLFRVTCTYLRSALAEKGFPDIWYGNSTVIKSILR
jgi:two-component SAPR family response regulator